MSSVDNPNDSEQQTLVDIVPSDSDTESSDSSSSPEAVQVLLLVSPASQLSLADAVETVTDVCTVAEPDDEIISRVRDTGSWSGDGVRVEVIRPDDDILSIVSSPEWLPAPEMHVSIDGFGSLIDRNSDYPIRRIMQVIGGLYAEYRFVSAVGVISADIDMVRQDHYRVLRALGDAGVSITAVDWQELVRSRVDRVGGKHRGRPPVGFQVDDGCLCLVPSDNYDMVCDVLSGASTLNVSVKTG